MMQHPPKKALLRESPVTTRTHKQVFCELSFEHSTLLIVSRGKNEYRGIPVHSLDYYILNYIDILNFGKNQLVMFNVDTTDLGKNEVKYLIKINGLPFKLNGDGMKNLLRVS